jgi:hypothetical protein
MPRAAHQEAADAEKPKVWPNPACGVPQIRTR